MCGRFTLTSPADTVAELFELAEVPEIAPRYNIAPTQPVPVVFAGVPDGRRRLAMMHWGLIPPWAPDPGMGARMINARAETVASKPAFRSAFRRRRCLIVADGFYEWQKLESPEGRGRPRKQPHYIRLRDGRPFAFAGLWERWKPPEETEDPRASDPVESCTIITTEPNELIAALHNRMPAVLHPRDYDVWLDPGTDSADVLQPLLRPYPPDEMEAYPVTTRVNTPSIDARECIQPLE
jgi:putative SOS response-associated peptidase YedK